MAKPQNPVSIFPHSISEIHSQVCKSFWFTDISKELDYQMVKMKI